MVAYIRTSQTKKSVVGQGGWIHKVDHGGATQGEEELLLLNVEIYNAQHVVSRHYLKADYM